MKTSLLNSVEKDQREELTHLFKSSVTLRRALIKVLKDKEEAAISAALLGDGYNIANWSQYMADRVGYIRAIREALSLLED